MSTNNNITLKNGWSAELNFTYNSQVRSGYMAGVQKLDLKNKGTLRFNITDIFWTNLPKAMITYNNYIEK